MNGRRDDTVASLGVPVEIVPGLSAFGYEHTPSNSYRFVWTGTAINRDTNNLVTASIELFRNGDVCVTTNGVAAYLPRELPFPHNGFGQDDEWVAANFTNATEILGVGYPQWVDAQVGTGLTNGLYKLTVSVADDPPETTQISVGGYSVAVTNAGEYVFLLEKCTDYLISVFPETATNFVYSAVDDIAPRPLMFGTVVFEGVYGYDEGFGERPLVYSDASCTEAVEPGSEFPVISRADWSMPLYFNPATVSASHPGVLIKARWRPGAGAEVTASKRLTIVSPVAEPVCNATTNVVEDGEEHCYAVNPCGVAVGREAYFRVDVAPAEFPDSEIVWVKSQGLDFVGPDRGRRVTVRGIAPGYESLEVHVGGRTDYAPTFQVRVVEPVTVNLRAWIIGNGNNKYSRTVDQVRQMVKDANDVYAQVGVTLNLVEPVVVTNIPDAYDALYWTPTNATPQWTYSRIVDIDSNTGGLECYFVNAFVDNRTALAANGPRGAVITRRADFKDFAHEIGHQFGMDDIYVDSSRADDPGLPLISLSTGDTVNRSRARWDWNGGCDGSGAGGARYYAANTKMVNILSRMLMKGTRGSSDNPVDITAGDIYGVFYTNDVSNAEMWVKGNAPVMFPFDYRNISHR